MHFEYEITADDYVAAHLLYWRLSGGRKGIKWTVIWILGGVSFIFIVWYEGVFGW